MRTFKQILEEVQAENSEKLTRLEDYNDKLKYFNSNTSRLVTILSKPQEQWEEEAKKIINGNVYLSKQWGLTKAQKTIDDAQKKISSGDMTSEEVSDLNKKIATDKSELQKDKQELDKLIKNDLKEIQSK